MPLGGGTATGKGCGCCWCTGTAYWDEAGRWVKYVFQCFNCSLLLRGEVSWLVGCGAPRDWLGTSTDTPVSVGRAAQPFLGYLWENLSPSP